MSAETEKKRDRYIPIEPDEGYEALCRGVLRNSFMSLFNPPKYSEYYKRGPTRRHEITFGVSCGDQMDFISAVRWFKDPDHSYVFGFHQCADQDWRRNGEERGETGQEQAERHAASIGPGVPEHAGQERRVPDLRLDQVLVFLPALVVGHQTSPSAASICWRS